MIMFLIRNVLALLLVALIASTILTDTSAADARMVRKSVNAPHVAAVEKRQGQDPTSIITSVLDQLLGELTGPLGQLGSVANTSGATSSALSSPVNALDGVLQSAVASLGKLSTQGVNTNVSSTGTGTDPVTATATQVLQNINVGLGQIESKLQSIPGVGSVLSPVDQSLNTLITSLETVATGVTGQLGGALAPVAQTLSGLGLNNLLGGLL